LFFLFYLIVLLEFEVLLTPNIICPMLSRGTREAANMATSFDNLWGSATPSGGSVPPVEAADLRSMWSLQSGVQALRPGEQIMISAESYKQACGPEADVRAVYERVSHLWMLREVGVLPTWVHDGVPDDAVFHVAATIPMSRMQTGVVYKKPPFDVDEFVKQVQKRIQS
jgi:hypothetical protein